MKHGLSYFCKALVLSASLVFSLSSHASGLPVIDLGAILQLVLQLSELKRQTEQIKNQLQVMEMLKGSQYQMLDGLKGHQYQWSNTQRLINDLGSIVNKTNRLAYSASNIDHDFQQAYPGYQAPQDFNKQYKNNVDMTQNTLNSVLQAMGASAKNFENENERLKFLQTQAQNAKGQTQAIQASNQIASEMVSQIQLLRQTVIAQSNAQIVYYATQVQHEAHSKAELEKVINNGSTNVMSYGTSGHHLNAPDF